MASSISGKAKLALAALALGSICLLGPSTLSQAHAQEGQFSFGPGPRPCSHSRPCGQGATLVSVIEFPNPSVGHAVINSYSISPGQDGSLVGTFNLPSIFVQGGPATDSAGQIYVLGNFVEGLLSCQILVYPAGSAGATTPSRTIDAPGCTEALTVDPVGRLYAGYMPGNNTVPTTVSVYSATATGAATPLRTLQLTDVEGINDIAADAAGNIYVAAYMRPNSQPAVAVYSPDASGPATSSHTIPVVGAGVVGVAVDAEGDIFANVVRGYSNSPEYVIEEFAPGADGAAAPTNTIRLPPTPALRSQSYGVRVDGAGNVFTMVYLDLIRAPEPNSFALLYGFARRSTAAATPIVQVTFPPSFFMWQVYALH
jgi:hypothetical protein